LFTRCSDCFEKISSDAGIATANRKNISDNLRRGISKKICRFLASLRLKLSEILMSKRFPKSRFAAGKLYAFAFALRFTQHYGLMRRA
jgi:hypothetical protein